MRDVVHHINGRSRITSCFPFGFLAQSIHFHRRLVIPKQRRRTFPRQKPGLSGLSHCLNGRTEVYLFLRLPFDH